MGLDKKMGIFKKVDLWNFPCQGRKNKWLKGSKILPFLSREVESGWHSCGFFPGHLVSLGSGKGWSGGTSSAVFSYSMSLDPRPRSLCCLTMRLKKWEWQKYVISLFYQVIYFIQIPTLHFNIHEGILFPLIPEILVDSYLWLILKENLVVIRMENQ